MTTVNQDRLTLAQAREMFGVTQMSLYLWRKGSATRAPLPVEKPRAKLGESPTQVLFCPEKLAKWAKKHDVAIAVDAAKILKRYAKAEAPKRGPKPKTAAKVESKPARRRVVGHSPEAQAAA